MANAITPKNELARKRLTQERLKSLFHYEPETGVFTRLVGGHGRMAGERAGAQNREGYRVIQVDGVTYLEHRLAWLYVTGQWPDLLMDHIDRNKTDNRFANLRIVTPTQSNANRRFGHNNKLKLKGVRVTPFGRYQAIFKSSGAAVYIGTYDSAEEANAAYRKAIAAHFGEYACLD